MTPPFLRASPPRRFRRRLVLVMLATGLLPGLLWGVTTYSVMNRALSVSLSPLESLLERVAAQLANANGRENDEGPASVRGQSSADLDGHLREAQLSLAQAELARRSLARLAPLAFGAMVMVSIAILVCASIVLGRALSVPIESLAMSMAAYARGDLSHKIVERRSRNVDELEYLVRQFNWMGSQLEAQRRRLQVSEHLAAWQTVARTMAHDLKNPLTAMQMSLARLLRTIERSAAQVPPERVKELATTLQEEIGVLLRMTDSFSTFAKLPPPVPKTVKLRSIVEDVGSLYSHGSPVPVILATGEQIEIDADEDQLRRAIGNLVKNALEASRPDDGPVRISVTAENGSAVIAVTDRGRGIAQPIEGPQMVQSLGSTKPGGSGLGLPIAYKILSEHGGMLRLEPNSREDGGGGTRAVATIPIKNRHRIRVEDPTP
ncbi:MAG: ATP-binding protein [Pseudomonadota bacterium]